ncbi:DUF6470 family protein [Desulfothermobacter acidiphilus]|uniref:DUF6470 family protein n=1 Tax=Desulfothermobacter acidiphilus TaxID=1938353 RepID=UPI003F8AF265
MQLLYVSIDQSQCWRELGLLSPWDIGTEGAKEGKKAALEAIGRWAEEGDYLAAIEKGNSVADLVAKIPELPELILDLLPHTRPKIYFVPKPSIFIAKV